ncbi:MAG: bifunctional methionine sulfoxide reductase B/A protein [Candidatus Zixiibacteriota bacterium]
MSDAKNKYNELTPQERHVIENKGTEAPYTGKYNDHFQKGIYTCRKCDLPLYNSSDKFEARCGWPSFDDEIPAAIHRSLDADGLRIEITCAYCGAHLGHVFDGEKLTSKNTRHCVNSISMNFIPIAETPKRDRAIFAAGCFWGVEHILKEVDGIVDTRVGYIGGNKKNPSYREVCYENTGHAEAVEVIYDPQKVSYEKIAKAFFELHDFTQKDGQGPDIGDQYRSSIFFTNSEQKKVAEKLVKILEKENYDVATEITEASTFWPAEDYHQNYYEKNGQSPYCHSRRNIFDK